MHALLSGVTLPQQIDEWALGIFNSMSLRYTFIMAQTLVLLCLTSVLAVGKGELIDFHAINKRQTATDGERDCQALGYDGLAVVSSPETYRYALRLTETLR